MAYQEYVQGGGGGGQPPKPPTPQAPPTAGEQAPAVQETPQAWDDPWERRARKLLGNENVGTKEDLADPEHRKWMRRKMRKKKRGQKADAAAVAPEEVAPEEEGTGAPGEEGGPKVPVAQGSADQLKGIEEMEWQMPGRRVPGGGDLGEQVVPGGVAEQERLRGMQDPTSQMETGLWTPEDQARQDGTDGARRPGAGGPEDQMQTGLWTPEDEARSQAADQAQGLDSGAPGGAGTAPTGEQYVTNAGVAPPDYPKGNVGSNFAQPATPWPPPPIQPTYYTGGM